MGALPLRIVVTSHAPCWISASVDGKRVPGRLLQAGDRLQLNATSAIVLTSVGDAGAVDYTINDAPGRALGKPGEIARNVVINLQNYQSFVVGR